MNSSQACGFLRRPSTTGPYSCGSSPYSAMISPISAASEWAVMKSKYQRLGCKSYTTEETGNVFANYIQQEYQFLGRQWSPPAPSSSPACSDLPHFGQPSTYHMARCWIRKSQSCICKHFLNRKQCDLVLSYCLKVESVIPHYHLWVLFELTSRDTNTKCARIASGRGPHTSYHGLTFQQ
jgi:hypothetical protein